jgi:tetratricopeptide (TPR) repeat protein
MASRPTPYTISVAALIALHCKESSPLYENAADPTRSRRDADALVQSLLLAHRPRSRRDDVSRWPVLSLFDRPVRDLIAAVREALGTTVALNFLSWIQVASSSVDSMQDLMSTCRRALSSSLTTAASGNAGGGGTVDPHSQCGTYLWSVCLGFEQLEFDSAALLWNDFRVQADEAAQFLAVPTPDQPGGEGDGSLDRIPTPTLTPPQWCLSSDQLVESLQRELERGTEITSHEGRDALRLLLQHHPDIPVAHFLQFLASMETGDVETAMSSLHQYLDRSILAPTCGSSAASNTNPLEFAATVMAFMYSAFGNPGVALAATEEAVRVAHQQAPNQDVSSVAFALGWLGLLRNESSKGGNTLHQARELIHRSFEHATDSNLRSLAAGASFVESRLLALSPHHHPSLAWIPLTQALTDNGAKLDGSTTSGMDRPTQTNDGTNGDEVSRLLGRQSLVASGIWHVLGNEPMSELMSQSLLQAGLENQGQLVPPDIAVAVQNMARCCTVGFVGGIADSLRAVSIESQLEMPFNFLDGTNPCVYARALRKLVGLRMLFGLNVQGVFLNEIGILRHEWAVRRGEFLLAESLSDAMMSHLSPRMPSYWAAVLDVRSQIAWRLSRQDRFVEALSLLRQLIIECRNRGNDVARYGRLLLQQSWILLESNPGSFCRALEPLLECVTISDAHDMNGLHAAALSLLGQVHLRMKNPVRAIAIIEAALPTLLQHEHVWWQAEAYLTLSKCQLRGAKKQRGRISMSGISPVDNRYLNLASRALERSESLFRLCEDCLRLRETYYLQARVFDSLNRVGSRNAAAKNFVVVSQHLQQANRLRSASSDASKPGTTQSLATLSDLPEWTERTLQAVAV